MTTARKSKAWERGYFDIIKGTGIDYMHGCLLGVTRALLALWLNPEHKNEEYSVNALIGLIDRRMTGIQGPCELSRCPRPLVDRKRIRIPIIYAVLFSANSIWSFTTRLF